MGRCESSTASIGIRILLSNLVLQINEENYDLIKEILMEGFIEDENEYYNEVYYDIIDCILNKNHQDMKEYLIDEFKEKGSYYKSKYGGRTEPTLYYGCLFDKYLLLPIKDILSCSRYGYDREGTNSVSRPIDFDLSVDVEKYKKIENVEIAFILNQSSG